MSVSFVKIEGGLGWERMAASFGKGKGAFLIAYFVACLEREMEWVDTDESVPLGSCVLIQCVSKMITSCVYTSSFF